MWHASPIRGVYHEPEPRTTRLARVRGRLREWFMARGSWPPRSQVLSPRRSREMHIISEDHKLGEFHSQALCGREMPEIHAAQRPLS